jgi:hypothetical protein
MHRLLDLRWPYIHQTQQHRTAPGQFRLANEIIYGGKVTIGEKIRLIDFPESIAIEKFLLSQNYGLKPSPPGEVLPVFTDISDSFCYVVPGGTSRANSGTAYTVFQVVRTLKKAVPDLQNHEIVVLAPYCQQRRGILLQICKSGEFAVIQVATVTGYHGWENKYVVCDFTVAANLGGKVGFVAERHRLAVALTRQVAFLWIIGDSRCTSQDKADKKKDNKKAEHIQDEEHLDDDFKYDLKVLDDTFRWFSRYGRVIHMNAANIPEDNELMPMMTESKVAELLARMNKRRQYIERRRAGEDPEEQDDGIQPDQLDESHGIPTVDLTPPAFTAVPISASIAMIPNSPPAFSHRVYAMPLRQFWSTLRERNLGGEVFRDWVEELLARYNDRQWGLLDPVDLGR